MSSHNEHLILATFRTFLGKFESADENGTMSWDSAGSYLLNSFNEPVSVLGNESLATKLGLSVTSIYPPPPVPSYSEELQRLEASITSLAAQFNELQTKVDVSKPEAAQSAAASKPSSPPKPPTSQSPSASATKVPAARPSPKPTLHRTRTGGLFQNRVMRSLFRGEPPARKICRARNGVIADTESAGVASTHSDTLERQSPSSTCSAFDGRNLHVNTTSINHTIPMPVDAASSIDHVCILNNYLQAHPSGNLTPLCSWVMRQEGPIQQVIHHATSMFRGVEIGHGTGTTGGLAKSAAAVQALQYLKRFYPN